MEFKIGCIYTDDVLDTYIVLSEEKLGANGRMHIETYFLSSELNRPEELGYKNYSMNIMCGYENTIIEIGESKLLRILYGF